MASFVCPLLTGCESFILSYQSFLSIISTIIMDRSNQSLEDMYAKMTLEEEDEGGVLVGEEPITNDVQTYVLVGRFLTDKNINFNAMQNVLASLWRPKEGMEVHDLGNSRYSFVFFHMLDLQKVMEGGPWTFEQSMLVFHHLSRNEDPHLVTLQEVDIWVQIYDIPKGFMSETILKNIGDSFGRYIKSDPSNFNNIWKDHVRIRVTMNIDKPLKRRMKLKRDANNWNWVNFKYERLSSFCFVCGIIGHSDRDCNVVYANPDKLIERAYGVWLRAPTRINKIGTGARWLRNVNDGGTQWGTSNTSSEASATAQGGGGAEPKFMEVDGVFREIHGKQEAVRVVTHNYGDKDSSNLELNQEETADNILNLEERVILDPKRRRVETDTGLEGINIDQNGKQADGLENDNGPKNVEVAGSGFQARQAL